MGILDTLFNQASKELTKQAKKGINMATKKVEKGIEKAITTKNETFTFTKLPETVEEMKALKEAELKTPYQAAALGMVALCAFEHNPDATFEMMEFLNGPDDVSTYDKKFITERLSSKKYLPRSFFEGATPKNGYTPKTPYKITVSSNQYSFNEENYASLQVMSGGADNPRIVKLRKKPSTGEWFVHSMQVYTDIRIPESENPWA